MDKEKLMSQTEFSFFYGVSQAMVSKYVIWGKIPKSCLKKEGKYLKIKPDCAVAALEKSLSPIKRKSRTKEPDPCIEAYNEFLNFDARDHDALGGMFSLSLDILSVISEAMNPDVKAEMEGHIEALARIFGCRRVHVENLKGKRCVDLEGTI